MSALLSPFSRLVKWYLWDRCKIGIFDFRHCLSQNWKSATLFLMKQFICQVKMKWIGSSNKICFGQSFWKDAKLDLENVFWWWLNLKKNSHAQPLCYLKNTLSKGYFTVLSASRWRFTFIHFLWQISWYNVSLFKSVSGVSRSDICGYESIYFLTN